MLEYASMRFTFFCCSATRLPKIIVAAASHQITGIQCSRIPGNASSQRRMSAANAAVLTPAAMNAVYGVGAPS